MQQSVKDSVINQLKQIKVLAAHADDYNVKLTKSEKKQIKESVTAFAKDSTGKKVMKKTEADKDMIQKLYEESTIASKVMQEIIKKANEEFLERLGGETYKCPIPAGIKPQAINPKK